MQMGFFLRFSIEWIFLPWCSNGIEKCNKWRNIYWTPLGYFNFRNQNSCRHHHTIKHECYNMTDNFPYQKEVVDHIKPFANGDFLRYHSSESIQFRHNHKFWNYDLFSVKHTLFLAISITIFLKRFAGPQDHLCCWNRKALRVLGNSLLTWIHK